MTPKLLEKLNERFREFGTTPSGGLKFQWANARSLFYLYENGTKEVFKPFIDEATGRPEYDADGIQRGIWGVRTTYERHSHADRYGDVWIMTTWVAPLSEREWLLTVGTDFPWPRDGEYHPIDSTALPLGQEPDEALTQFVAYRLYQHLGMKVMDHLDASKEQVARRENEQRGEWSDIVDDVIPAFGNIPGTKEHVSFPSVGVTQ